MLVYQRVGSQFLPHLVFVLTKEADAESEAGKKEKAKKKGGRMVVKKETGNC